MADAIIALAANAAMARANPGHPDNPRIKFDPKWFEVEPTAATDTLPPWDQTPETVTG